MGDWLLLPRAGPARRRDAHPCCCSPAPPEPPRPQRGMSAEYPPAVGVGSTSVFGVGRPSAARGRQEAEVPMDRAPVACARALRRPDRPRPGFGRDGAFRNTRERHRCHVARCCRAPGWPRARQRAARSWQLAWLEAGLDLLRAPSTPGHAANSQSRERRATSGCVGVLRDLPGGRSSSSSVACSRSAFTEVHPMSDRFSHNVRVRASRATPSATSLDTGGCISRGYR
jgi:hypothetical protein